VVLAEPGSSDVSVTVCIFAGVEREVDVAVALDADCFLDPRGKDVRVAILPVAVRFGGMFVEPVVEL
jgi:hypothetical protein